jgi:hypothetical protein
MLIYEIVCHIFHWETRYRGAKNNERKPAMPDLYSQTLSRQYPGLFVILLDQSESMIQEDANGMSKAKIVTTYVNIIIQKMIEIAQVDEFAGRRKNYAYVSILGYNDNVYPLLTSPTPMSLPDLDDKPLGIIANEKLIPDASGKIAKRVKEKIRVWVKPHASGQTDMTLAFEEAERVIRDWLDTPPEAIEQAPDGQTQKPRSECFPPILINITDAKHNGPRDPSDVINRISQMGTDYGQVLIYNCHFTHENAKPCFFPATLNELQQYTSERQAGRMFEMSSKLPNILTDKAEKYWRRPIPQGSRCFIYNADPDVLLRFLQWGTLGGL